jgi:hypothetical protein
MLSSKILNTNILNFSVDITLEFLSLVLLCRKKQDTGLLHSDRIEGYNIKDNITRDTANYGTIHL